MKKLVLVLMATMMVLLSSVSAAAEETKEPVRILQAAGARLGASYGWGSAGDISFDCSGLVWRALFDCGYTHVNGRPIPMGTAIWREYLQYVNVGDTVTFTGNGLSLNYILTSKDARSYFEIPGSILLYNDHIVLSAGAYDQNEKSAIDFVREQYGIDATGYTADGSEKCYLYTGDKTLCIEAFGTQRGEGNRGVIVSDSVFSNKQIVACLVPEKEYREMVAAKEAAALKEAEEQKEPKPVIMPEKKVFRLKHFRLNSR